MVSEEHVRLLTTGFQSLAVSGTKTLHVRAVGYCNACTDRWDATARTFHITMRAIAESGLQLDRLTIFWCDVDCSLACSELDKVNWESPALLECIANLKSLSLRLSNPREEPLLKTSAEAVDEENLAGLTRLLRHCTSLESLELRYYKLASPFPSTASAKHLEQIADTVKLPLLKTLKLHGLVAREQALYSLLKSATVLEQLELNNVVLCQGTPKRFLDYCSRKQGTIRHLYLCDVFEHHLEHSSIRHRLKLIESPLRGRSRKTLLRRGPQVAKPIDYETIQDGTINDTALADWEEHEEYRLEDGPL